MTFRKLMDNIQKRILKHWQTTLKGLVYGVVTFMYFEGKITTTEWITAVGSILTINSIFLQKDPDKTANKIKPQEATIDDEVIR